MERGFSIAYDIRGAQSLAHPERGIARWVTEHALALAADPACTSGISLIGDPGRPIPGALHSRFPDALTDPRQIARACSAQRPVVHHLGSPFEGDYPVSEFMPTNWPRAGVIRSVTLYDVIPLLKMDGWSQEGQDWWRRRASVVRTADVVLCISEHTAEDGMHYLGLPPHKVHVVGTGLNTLMALTDPIAPSDLGIVGLKDPYVMYCGGTEHPRKNIPGLVRAFGLLPADTQARHQLVIVGRMTPEFESELRREAERAGVIGRTVLPGFVSDKELARLYASCACFCYPSQYEGFGMPVVEAMAAGAPAICSARTSCTEIAPLPGATFDPDDNHAIARSLHRVLTDDAWRDQLRAAGRRQAGRHSWTAVASRSVQAWENHLAGRAFRRRQLHPRAVITMAALSAPTPLTPSGSFHLLAQALSAERPVDLASPAVNGAAGAAVRHRRPPRSGSIAARPDGPLVWLVDSQAALTAATKSLGSSPGIAIVWEPDLVCPEGRGLGDLVSVASDVIVRDGMTGPIERAGGRSVRVLNPPLTYERWRSANALPPPLEAFLMHDARRRQGVRAERAERLIVIPKPPRFGPLTLGDITRAMDHAQRVAMSHRATRVSVLGDARDGLAADIAEMTTRRNLGAAFTWAAWPRRLEMLAWATAADAVVSIDPANLSLSAAALDLAALGATTYEHAPSEAGPGSPPPRAYTSSLAGRDAHRAAQRLVEAMGLLLV